jgi:hypothetical protein
LRTTSAIFAHNKNARRDVWGAFAVFFRAWVRRYLCGGRRCVGWPKYSRRRSR